MSKKILLYPGVFIMSLLSLWYTYQTQPSVNYAQCKLCDGKQYLAAYQYFGGQKPAYQVRFPFHSRVVVPWVAARLEPNQVSRAFAVIHWLGVFLTVCMLLFGWQSLGLPWHLQCVGIGWLLFHWIGIVRFNVYDPVTVDVPLYVFHSLLLLLLIYPRWLWCVLFITPVAVAQKESWLAVMLVLALYELIVQRFFSAQASYSRLWLFAGAVFAGIITKVLLNQWFAPFGGQGKNSIITVLFFVRETLQTPLDLVRWIVAMFMGFGGWWLLAWQNTGKPHKKLTILPSLIVLVVLHLLLGILAGRDMTRIMFLGYPFIMTLILWLIQKETKLLLIFVGVLSLPLLRVLSVIPLQTSQNEAFKTWFSEYASIGVVAAWAVYMMAAFWLITKMRQWEPALRQYWENKKVFVAKRNNEGE